MARERAGRRRVLVLFSKDVSAPAEDLIRSHGAEEFQVWVWRGSVANRIALVFAVVNLEEREREDLI